MHCGTVSCDSVSVVLALIIDAYEGCIDGNISDVIMAVTKKILILVFTETVIMMILIIII